MWPRYLCFSMIQMRIKLLKEIVSGSRTIWEVTSLLSVSRQSVSKWLARYRIEGEAWIVPKKCWPKSGIPVNRTDATTEEIIGIIARNHPCLWPVGLRDKLIEQTGRVLHATTIYRILRRTGIRYKKKGEWRQKQKKLYVLDDPGREVQLDACFPFGRQRRETQYDALDDCSRFTFSDLHTEHCVRASMEFVANLISKAPFRIQRIRTDCGMEFGPWFTKYLESIWIEHVKTPPYSPQHNGKVERYHRTLWQHMGDYSMKIDAQEYRLKLKLFQDWYNYQKPHSGLWMFGMTPAEKIGYCLVQKVLQKQRESEEPWGKYISLDVNLTLQFNMLYYLCIFWENYYTRRIVFS